MKEMNQTEEMMKNLTPEAQASFVSSETVEMTEEAMHKASMEINERWAEIKALPREEASKLRREIMRKYMDETQIQ